MRPQIAAVVAEMRLAGDWPTPKEFGAMLLKAGADAAELRVSVPEYSNVLFGHVRWADTSFGPHAALVAASASANDELLDTLSSFRVDRGDEAAAKDFLASLRSFNVGRD